MAYQKRKLEDLNVMDDFLISAVAADGEVGAEFCKKILSVLLQKKIGKIRVMSQKVIMASTPECRGIRLDVEVEEAQEGEMGFPALNVYDMEPHLRKKTNFPRHNRFYQAKIDGRYLKSGEENFDNLPNLYVITITDFDPFEKDYMVYTVRNYCEEDMQMEYDDGLRFYYFNSKGKKGGSPAIKAMLDYMQESTIENVVNEDIKEIHKYVNEVKLRPEVREQYMRLDEIIEQAQEEAVTESYIEDILEWIGEYGEISQSLEEQIRAEDNPAVLKTWLRIAARAHSTEEFENEIHIFG